MTFDDPDDLDDPDDDDDCDEDVDAVFVVVNRGSFPGLDKHESASDFQRGHSIHHIGPCHWIILCKTPVNVLSASTVRGALFQS